MRDIAFALAIVLICYGVIALGAAVEWIAILALKGAL